MSTSFTITPELQKLLNTLKTDQFENNIAYMYVDSTHKITVGVGHNLTAHGDVARQNFLVKRFDRKAVVNGDHGVPITNKVTNRPATLAEIHNDFNFLNKHKGLGRYGPEQLQSYTTLELTQAAIDQLFDQDLNTAIGVCQHEFTSFSTFPAPCQAGLIDIAFNAGSFKSFQTVFAPAIKGKLDYGKKTAAERWKIAADSCHRGHGVSQIRNTTVKNWFLAGAASGAKP